VTESKETIEMCVERCVKNTLDEYLEQMHVVQAAIGRFVVAMKDWQETQDSALQFTVEETVTLNLEVARLKALLELHGIGWVKGAQ